MRLVAVAVPVVAALVAMSPGTETDRTATALQLVFTTDSLADGSRELHLVSLDGEPATRLTRQEPRGHIPSYLPDGSSIVFTSFGGIGSGSGDAVWLASSAGRALRRISPPYKHAEILSAVPSPDGRTVAVIDGSQDLWLVDVATGSRRRLPRATFVWDVAWSPDGGRLAFSYGSTESSGVSVIRRDGSGSRRITPPQTPREASDEFIASDLRWAPDGSAVAYAWGSLGEGGGLRIAPVGAGRLHTLGIGDEPAWSPDARRVAFVNGRSIFVARRDGLGRQLARAHAEPSALTWSADGSTIGFLAGDPPLRGVAVRTGRIRALTRPLRLAVRARHPQWSPRGDAAVSGDGAVFLAGVSTKWRRILLGGTDSDPSWSRDGQVVAFQRDRGKRTSILLLPPGADPRAIAEGREPRIAPDGEHVAFYRDSGLFVWSSDGTVTRVGPTGDGVDWSPDSTRLAWTNGNALYVAPRGGSPRLVTRNTRCDRNSQADVGSAAWSPDGRTIAFGVEDWDAVCAELASVDVARGSIRSLGKGASARWSPDGTALAVEYPYEGIRIIDRSGTVLGRWEGREPSWAPDNSWVAYSSETGRPPTAKHVYVRRRDGSGVRRLTSGVSINSEPTFRPASG